MTTRTSATARRPDLGRRARQAVSRRGDAASLSADRRAGVASDLERVLRHLADPDRLITAESRSPLLTGLRPPGGPIAAVEFPGFVADLIDGVFDAVVDASIRQMEAYADLLGSVAASIDELGPIDEQAARDWLDARFPDLFTAPACPARFADACRVIGANDRVTTERRLIAATRRRLAKDRQQLLATMVLMGVNRIVVTDGTVRPTVGVRASTR